MTDVDANKNVARRFLQAAVAAAFAPAAGGTA